MSAGRSTKDVALGTDTPGCNSGVGTHPCAASGLEQAGVSDAELSNNWKVASTRCEVKQGQLLLLLGDLARTPTWLCKPGHATAGSTDSAGPSLSLLVHTACFSSTVPSGFPLQMWTAAPDTRSYTASSSLPPTSQALHSPGPPSPSLCCTPTPAPPIHHIIYTLL